MPSKLGRKAFPSGFSPEDFSYQGQPAKDQDDFGDGVGLADMKCVNQFGKNANKYYHAGVVKDNAGGWWVYLEWGRAKNGKSWNGVFSGQDFQFWSCSGEAEARAAFQKQCQSKNVKRLERKDGIWVGKKGKDGYVVQKLATRENGLPDAYSIKDATGVKVTKKPKKVAKKTAKARPTLSYHPQEIKLVRDLVGGTQSYVARSVKEAGGVQPTVEALSEVRDILLPKALQYIVRVGNKTPQDKGETQTVYDYRLALACTRDKKLQQLSNYVSSLIPRPDPGRSATAEVRALATVLSSGNILSLQQDLDAMEGALANEDFDVEDAKQVQGVDVDARMNAVIRWVDPATALGMWVEKTYRGMSNNRHGHIRGKLVVKNIFTVVRPDRDTPFVKAVKKVAANRKGSFSEYARLQPSRRTDLKDISDYAADANVFLGIHGTRAVNIAPILQTNLRLPKSLPGALITGAAFGNGIYWASDVKKSLGYVGGSGSYWTSGGAIKGRGFFMFLADVIMGKAHMCRSTGSWSTPPNKCDSVAAYPEYSSVANDEHIIFDPSYQRIRYLIEGEMR